MQAKRSIFSRTTDETHARRAPRGGKKESGHPLTHWFWPFLADFLNPSRFRKRPQEQPGGWPTVD